METLHWMTAMNRIFKGEQLLRLNRGEEPLQPFNLSESLRIRDGLVCESDPQISRHVAQYIRAGANDFKFKGLILN